VALALEDEWPEPLRVALRADLSASLRDEGFELVHAADGAAGVLALVRIAMLEHGKVRVRIEDALTERVLELAAAPRDAWSVAIAAGADELLRASWVELMLDDAPPPVSPPPPAVERSLARHVAPERVRSLRADAGRFRLAARAGLEFYRAGELYLGGDLLARLRLLGPLALELALGGRAAPEHESSGGSVRSWSAGGDLSLALGVLPASLQKLELDLVLGLRAAYVAYQASANQGSTATSADGALLVLRASARPALRLGPLWLALQLGLGVPLLGVEAVDDGKPVVGAAELELHSALLVGVVR
jgi:hypothetical protein